MTMSQNTKHSRIIELLKAQKPTLGPRTIHRLRVEALFLGESPLYRFMETYRLVLQKKSGEWWITKQGKFSEAFKLEDWTNIKQRWALPYYSSIDNDSSRIENNEP